MKSVHIEYLALETSASLVDVCALARSALGLPGLSFDSEDATEWGSCWLEGIEYNVSRPHEPGTLHEWDGSVPDGCDVAMFLGLDASHPRVATQRGRPRCSRHPSHNGWPMP